MRPGTWLFPVFPTIQAYLPEIKPFPRRNIENFSLSLFPNRRFGRALCPFFIAPCVQVPDCKDSYDQSRNDPYNDGFYRCFFLVHR